MLGIYVILVYIYQKYAIERTIVIT